MLVHSLLDRQPSRARRWVQQRQAREAVVRWAMTSGLALLVLLAAVSTVRAQPAGAPSTFADLAERLSPAVVNISTTQVNAPALREGARPPLGPQGSPFEEFLERFREFEGEGRRRPRRSTSLGSGFIIDPSGLVVTNNHVIENADEIRVILGDDTTYEATVLGRDAKTDLALLRVNADRSLPSVNFGDSEDIRVGDWVLAIGNPFGLGGTVTTGIISARGRNINAGPYDDFLQTDAAINRGNSGGPMFNTDGEVIGVNTAIFSPTGASVGIGFAIPSNIAEHVIDQLREFGRTRRGWLGVRIQEVTPDLAEGLGLDRPRGALVADVTPSGPAAGTGIARGDVVIEFNGQDVSEMRELPRIVAETLIGIDVPVVVWRDGRALTFTVRVGDLEGAEDDGLLASNTDPGAEAPVSDVTVLGMRLAMITPSAREEYQLPADITGVLVLEVEGDSNAAERGVRPGDVIREINRDVVDGPDAVVGIVQSARRSGNRTVLALVETEGDSRFVALSIR